MWPQFESWHQHHMSFLLVLSLTLRGFSLGTLVFPSHQKPTFPKSKSTRNQADEEPLCGCATSKSLLYFIYLKKIYVLKGMPPRPSNPDPVVRQKSFNYTSSYNIIHPVVKTLVSLKCVLHLELCFLKLTSLTSFKK